MNNQLSHFILDEKNNVIPVELLVWAKWLEHAGEQRIVEQTNIGKKGRISVLTVFLGLNHRLNNEGPPLLFETMVFGGEWDQETDRYSTWKEAENGHKKMVKKVKQN